MAGNSRRQGATRKTGTKKGATVGSGGQRARGLAGKGPTPKATDRTGHPAARRAGAAKGPAGGGKPAARTRGRSAKDVGEVVVGRNSVLEALQAGVPGTALYVAERIDSDDRVRQALKLCADGGIPLLEAPRPELDRLSDGTHHQGLALQVPAYEYAHPDDLLARAGDRAPLVVALDGVTDPRNLGAVLRSAEAFGAHGVLIPERRAAGMSAGAWKAAAGAGARLPVARATNLTRALTAYQKAGLMVVALAGGDGVAVADLHVAADPLCLVVGAEGAGVSRLVGERADIRAHIPMTGPTESLNAGVAAGIALYEIARLRS